MTYTTEYKRTGPIIIGVYGIYVKTRRDLSLTLYIYVRGSRPYVKVNLHHGWRPMEGDDVVYT